MRYLQTFKHDFNSMSGLSIYDGQIMLGRVLCVRGQWRAFAADNHGGFRRIGTFSSSKTAADAIFNACRFAG
jgi:hypothetical protein